eukprot:365323-Chlamydomonas_euryale.AAC.17
MVWHTGDHSGTVRHTGIDTGTRGPIFVGHQHEVLGSTHMTAHVFEKGSRHQTYVPASSLPALCATAGGRWLLHAPLAAPPRSWLLPSAPQILEAGLEQPETKQLHARTNPMYACSLLLARARAACCLMHACRQTGGHDLSLEQSVHASRLHAACLPRACMRRACLASARGVLASRLHAACLHRVCMWRACLALHAACLHRVCMKRACFASACGVLASRMHAACLLRACMRRACFASACGVLASRLHAACLPRACMRRACIASACGVLALRLHAACLHRACMRRACLAPACGVLASRLHAACLHACLVSACADFFFHAMRYECETDSMGCT